MLETIVPTDPQQRTHAIENLILSVAKALVDDQGSVAVTASDDERGTTITLTVATDDLGKVIGKQGRTARSMRVVLQAASSQLGRTVSLDIKAVAPDLEHF